MNTPCFPPLRTHAVHSLLVALVLVVLRGDAGGGTLRPPSVPLVAHDPYFSIWSPADRLTDAETVHWTGKTQRLTSLLRLDGKVLRVMGATPGDIPALPQVDLEVLPTRTLHTFEGGGVRLKLTFMTPALPEDLAVLSRPVTYLTWEMVAVDGREHEAALTFEASGEPAVNLPGDEVVSMTQEIGEIAAAVVGSRKQAVLARKGDDLRIDWGYFYVAQRKADVTGMTLAVERGGKREVLQSGTQSRGELMHPVPAGSFSMAIDSALGQVGAKPVSRWLMLAYDDQLSIKYFKKNLAPYWRRDGDDAPALIRRAAADYERLKKRCEEFDAGLMEDLRRTGGPEYAQLCALAYRQTFAGNKIVADANGHPLMFPKENFSNGCIGTVDVLFPQAPFFLLFSPGLTKAMLVPILDYAASPSWPHGYAPHDLGTYPHANGQVYGMEGRDGDRMPVEESGNMLIMLAALARQQGNAQLATRHWPMLNRWADYLVKEGLDPTNQLCSADMFGHLPRNANLAIKAIIGIGAFGQLCDFAGKAVEARKYLGIARDYAGRWQALAGDEGHTRLAYHLPGSWGMKHNLIWDRVLGLHLFPESVGDGEVAWYLKVQNKYGLPVDSRTDTCLIDWAMWSIALARNDSDFRALTAPLLRYAQETPNRVPLGDWFTTTNAAHKGMQARPVVGGLVMRTLADEAVWKRRAGRGADVEGQPAPFPRVAPMREAVPTARTARATWRYTLEKPADGWTKPEFDDSLWKQGVGGFGTAGTPGAVIGTEWDTKQIWLRREFDSGEKPLKNPRLLVVYDEDPEIYVNGVFAAGLTGWATGYEEVEMTPGALAQLKQGRVVMAVHASQTSGGQSIDVGIAEDGEPGKPMAAAKPPGGKSLPGLRQLMETPLRDTSICRGPDGVWYMTGTVQPFWDYNEGIQVWRSKDLAKWEPLGFVWKYGGSPWHKPYLDKRKPLWAPEIHFLKNTFWLTYSIPGWDGTGKTSGCGLLRSASGRAEGPYEDVQPERTIGDEIDASLFQEDDGTVYYVWHSGKIARMKPDMSGLAEPWHWLKTTGADPRPGHHSGLCAGIFGKDSFDHVGFEGAFIFKAGGTYFLSCADSYEGRYSCMVSSSTNLFGPYSPRYEAIPHGGHNMFFKDDNGRWWSSFFGSDPRAPIQERPGILPIRITKDGRIEPE